MKHACLALVLLVAALAPVTALAQIPMTGRFVAEARCPALQSIRNRTNPGAVATEPGRSYALIGRNADPASHYYVTLPDADPQRRWVAVGCGRIEPLSQSAERKPREPAGTGALAEALASSSRRPETSSADPSRNYVLAASWHAAFCESRPSSRDCTSGGFDRGFTLHGLWPQPRGREYCDVSRQAIASDRAGDWRRLPAPKLEPETRRALARVMPGTKAFLERHEWIRHGSCYGADAERYFSDAVALIDALNRSGIGRLFEASIGRRLGSDRIRSAFDEAFGSGAGRRVLVDCVEDEGRRLIGELRVNLSGRVSGAALSALIRAAEPASRGCDGGFVDASGY